MVVNTLRIAVMTLAICAVLRAATLPPGFVEEQVGGTWNEAVGLTFAPDGRMFVWERAGRVWIVENGVKSATPFLDISAEVAGYRDFGLLGFALHPNFYNNGYVYALYVVDRHHLMRYGSPNYRSSSNEYYQATIGRLTRYTARASDGFRSVDPTSPRVLAGESAGTGFPILHESHGIGTVLFGTDGTLLVSCGDGASYASQDTGSASETYWQQALSDGIIRPKENVGAYRAQLVDCLNGKILRLDPETGNGVPGNPFYDTANPRSRRSRVWALGLRNPFRMTLRPGTGSHSPADARPGVLYIGDVGYATWEDLHVCDRPAQNFGWPAYEGLTAQAGYNAANVPNQDAPNPLFGAAGCNQQYFYFRDLIKQDSLLTPSWPNPCNTSQQIPASIPRFVHSRPAIEWRHGQTLARTGIYSNNQAAVINVGASGSPVSGSMFPGNSSTAGSWYTNSAFPLQFRNTYFHGDFGEGWIKSFVFTTNDKPTAVQNFASSAGGVVGIAVEPATGHLYYISWTTFLRRIRYAPGGNQPPIAVASANINFGPAPLSVQFSSAGSRDPDGQALTYRWNFGDGSPASTAANPSHTFNAPAGMPTPFTVALTVTDTAGTSATNRILISVNNTPPQVTITSPTNGTRYSVSNATTYNCTATVTDAEHSASQLKCAWQTILHHNDHSHSEPLDTNCTATTRISPVGCDGETYYYRVLLTVTDAAGLSATSEVQLNPACEPRPPAILTPPQSQTIVLGTTVTLSVGATGDVPLSYQWTRNGVNLPHQTNALLVMTNVQFADAAEYIVTVRNSLGAIASAPAFVNVRPPDVLIGSGAVWKYLDDGSDQETNYAEVMFDDSSWRSGAAQLGYGDDDEATTVRSNRTNGTRIMTTYFRRAFYVTNATAYTGLVLRVLRDDGVLVFLNDAEIFRNNLPTGAVSFNMQATATVGGAEESTLFLSTNVNPSRLREGFNVVAAEIHQVTNTSSDISFDLEMLGTAAAAERAVFLRGESAGAGRFRLWFAAETGTSYTLESTSDFASWSPISTNSAANARVDYTDVNAASGRRFFRARSAR